MLSIWRTRSSAALSTSVRWVGPSGVAARASMAAARSVIVALIELLSPGAPNRSCIRLK